MIPFNRSSFDGREMELMAQAVSAGHISGNGPLSRQAEAMLSQLHGGAAALLTTSCSHALELAARLCNLGRGDEVLVPSFTFVTTASSFMWNGAKPVFVDVDPVTLNMDLELAERAITARTKAICVVHYAGVGAQPDRFRALADDYGLILIEDNAHGLGGSWSGQPLGTFGALSTLSFHETKNITCGEGGALIVNDRALLERAEILREKGTDRTKFSRGLVDKYTWVDIGSSWVLSDLLSGVLVGQLERFKSIQSRRMEIWNAYAERLNEWADDQGVTLPVIPQAAGHTAHIFHLRFAAMEQRDAFIAHMKEQDVMAVFHYQALDISPIGSSLSTRSPACPVSNEASQTLVRLPLFASLSSQDVDQIISAVTQFDRPPTSELQPTFADKKQP